MAPFSRTAVLAVSLLLGSALAQEAVPATPPAPLPSPEVVPEPSPMPETPATPAPVEPAPPEPTEPAPGEPAPVQPVTPKPTPLPPATPRKVPTPLLITAQWTLPAFVNGKKTTVPFTRTLTLSPDRVTLLRAKGGTSASLDADLKNFLAELPREAQDARFEELPEGWAVVQRNGLRVDEAKTRANIQAALNTPGTVRASVAITGQVMPKRTLDFFASRGITSFLATGETNYSGSSAARMENIHVGTRNFQDRLFEGKVFSFNQFIGPISTRTGYVTGLVISGDRTANGVGGGICQVSTTAFRALYGAGLPITERRNHSYQVFYYDPQGLDATIYQPSQDLKFTTDTGGALWFQADWNDEEARLKISVFGKARPFTVEVGTPKVLSTTPSPPDRLIRDASLPAGQRKQVDWAAKGAVTEVTRRFLQGGKVLRQDTLKSVYRPWPNIFLVGTKR